MADFFNETDHFLELFNLFVVCGPPTLPLEYKLSEAKTYLATEPTLSIGPDLTLTCLRGRKDKSHHDMVTVPRSQGFGREWVVTQVTPRPGL